MYEQERDLEYSAIYIHTYYFELYNKTIQLFLC